MQKFSTRLISLRKERGLSQEELAQIVNKTRSAVSGYEIEDKEPPFDVLCLFAEYFGVSTDYLLGLTEELTPPAAAPPPPGPEPEPGLPPVQQQTAASLLAQENLNRLHGLLLREEQAGSDAAGALCWAISTLARLLDVSKLDTSLFSCVFCRMLV